LNWLFARPGTIALIARMAPVAGSIEMIAAAGSSGAVSVLLIARRASCCQCGWIVV
jgi:hypothetical protein